MTDTATGPETAIRLNWELIDKRCEELGATTGDERALLLGCVRAQLYRWRDGINDIGLSRAGYLAMRLGMTLSEIVAADPKPPSPPPPRPKPPPGPENPRPPAGPRKETGHG